MGTARSFFSPLFVETMAASGRIGLGVRSGLERSTRSGAAETNCRFGASAYLQVSATSFMDSTCTIGGRSAFGLAAALSSAGGEGCCTGPVTSTFLLTLVAHSDCDDAAGTYIAADPPSVLFST